MVLILLPRQHLLNMRMRLLLQHVLLLMLMLLLLLHLLMRLLLRPRPDVCTRMGGSVRQAGRHRELVHWGRRRPAERSGDHSLDSGAPFQRGGRAGGEGRFSLLACGVAQWLYGLII